MFLILRTHLRDKLSEIQWVGYLQYHAFISPSPRIGHDCGKFVVRGGRFDSLLGLGTDSLDYTYAI